MPGSSSRRIRRLFYCLISVCLACALSAGAQQLTLVSDTIYRADGTPARGSVVISWPAFNTSTGEAIAAGSRAVTLGTGGALQVPLAPNTGSVPAGTFYKVTMKLDSGTPSTEYWLVPQAATATLAQIRTRMVPLNTVLQGATREWVDLNVVHRSGPETVAGVKTFTSSPQVPSPLAASDAANKDYVDLHASGLGYIAENVANKNQPNGYAGLNAAGSLNAPIGAATPNPGAFTTLSGNTLQIGGQPVIDNARKLTVPSLQLNGSQTIGGIQGSTGTKLLSAAGSFTTGNVLTVDSSGNATDSGMAAAVLPTSASGTTSKYASVGTTFSANQCVHTDSSGNLTTTGSDCGAGSGMVSAWGIWTPNPSWPGTTVAGSPVPSNDAVIVRPYFLPSTVVVSQVSLSVAAGQTGATCDVGFYTPSGTLVVNTGGFSAASNGTQTVALLQGLASLVPGWYFFAQTCSSSSVALVTAGDSAGVVSIGNNLPTRLFGIAANSATSGALPSTTGAITGATHLYTAVTYWRR